MNDIEINDIREEKHFKGITFSEFKKTDVKKELLNSLIKSKIEPCCYWSAELICAGHFVDLWEIIIMFYSKFIQLANPKLAIYLDLRIQNFKQLITTGFLYQELRLRNSQKMRRLFCEIMCVLCEAKRKHSFTEIKIKDDDFDLTQMTERFKAPKIDYAEKIFKKDDPKTLFISINELGYSISDEGKNCIDACYWIEWILEFETKCKKKGENIHCERRKFAIVDPKLQMEVVWLIWDVLLTESINKSQIIQKVINCLLNIFCLKYTQSTHKKRKLILYFVVSLLTESVSFTEEIVSDKAKLETVTSNINNVYKQIKKNEHSPGTDYLFSNIKASNLEKTIAKLETMNTLGAEYISRVDND
jgi:hypothetical protein